MDGLEGRGVVVHRSSIKYGVDPTNPISFTKLMSETMQPENHLILYISK